MLAFATSPCGLGISEAQFWDLSPREYAALVKVWQNALDRTQNQFAHIMAAIHNGWMPRADKQPWPIERWLPNGKHVNHENGFRLHTGGHGPWRTQSVEDQMLMFRTMAIESVERCRQRGEEQVKQDMEAAKANFALAPAAPPSNVHHAPNGLTGHVVHAK